ncbi:MAG: hypothetical protein U9O94_00405 [Nanoarchaeota archaeon]|nr:hypothetical protein [Nanoarchaeota archaeon]
MNIVMQIGDFENFDPVLRVSLRTRDPSRRLNDYMYGRIIEKIKAYDLALGNTGIGLACDTSLRYDEWSTLLNRMEERGIQHVGIGLNPANFFANTLQNTIGVKFDNDKAEELISNNQDKIFRFYLWQTLGGRDVPFIRGGDLDVRRTLSTLHDVGYGGTIYLRLPLDPSNQKYPFMKINLSLKYTVENTEISSRR